MRMMAWLAALTIWAAVPQEAALQVGLAEIDITPPVGYRMDGYFYERLNTGQRDPLKAKALVFQQGATRAALVVCDVIGVPLTLSTEVRTLAAARTGIPAANIAVTATHSHTGPLFAGERARLFSERAAEKSGKDPLAEVKYVEELREPLAALDLDQQDPLALVGQRERHGSSHRRLAGPALTGDHMQPRHDLQRRA